MTNQEIFDTVLSGLRVQGGPCCDDHGTCMFRYKDKKCAIGFLIPDNLYSPIFETYYISDLIDKSIIKADSSQLGLLTELQNIHDNYYDEDDWEFCMKTLAKKYNLIFSPREVP